MITLFPYNMLTRGQSCCFLEISGDKKMKTVKYLKHIMFYQYLHILLKSSMTKTFQYASSMLNAIFDLKRDFKNASFDGLFNLSQS